MTPFLRSVADAYMSRYNDISEFRFIFPSKRAAVFFRKYLRESLPEGLVMLEPEISTITDLMADLSGLVTDSRIDLILQLYAVYRAMQPGGEVDFDRFRSWGETAVADFNDVEMYGVIAQELFKNLADFKEIRSNFLTEEQIDVIKEYFGGTPYDESVTTFWKHFRGNSDPDDTKRSFLLIWEAMGPLMERFNAELEKRGLAYPGMAFRRALERIESEGADAFRSKRVIFVGFNVLSTVEWSIFKALRKIRVTDSDGSEVPFADFYWDCTGPAMHGARNSAMHFMKSNIRQFPSRFPIDDSDVGELPGVLNVIAAPGNAAQAKIAGKILAELHDRLPAGEFHAAKVAVVLPDEGLLLPLMHSLPNEIESVNLTMGYPMKLTSVVSLLAVLRRMRKRARIDNDGFTLLFHEDVKALLSHPYVRLACGADAATEALDEISESRRFMLPRTWILGLIPPAKIFLPDLNEKLSGLQALSRLDAILMTCEDAVDTGEPDGLVKRRLDLSMIRSGRDALRRVQFALGEFDIDPSADTAARLAENMLASETVNFEGEPLSGVQIMGPLETRCLDFDYLIIASMNERIYPRRLHSRSFIPATLRRGYGMATEKFQESIFAYNFYRMISRAKEVYMIYDARSGGLKSGDVSRYLLQLKYLHAPRRVDWKSAGFDLKASDSKPVEIAKNGRIIELLNRYADPQSESHFSASLLTTYLECPLRFYLERLRGLKVEQEPEEFIDAATQGTIIHGCLQDIYRYGSADKPFLVKRKWLEAVIAETDAVRRIVRHRVNRHYLGLPDDRLGTPLDAEAELIAEAILSIVLNTLKFDIRFTPFAYMGSEIKRKIQVECGNAGLLNFKLVIDRLDHPDAGPIRIVDYKTGSVRTSIDAVSDIFEGKNGFKQAFQLLLYCSLYDRLSGNTAPLRPVIYNLVRLGTDRIATDSRRFPEIPVTIAGKKIDSHLDVKEEFEKRLADLMTEIMDPAVPFRQCTDRSHCRYCPFVQLCGR